MQVSASKGAGGAVHEAEPSGQVAPAARPQATASVVQARGGSEASPPADAQDPTFVEGGLTSTALLPGANGVHWPAAGFRAVAVPLHVEWLYVITAPGEQLTRGALQVQAPQVADGPTRPVPPRRMGEGNASGQAGDVPGLPS
jgi:hypothetical protein